MPFSQQENVDNHVWIHQWLNVCIAFLVLDTVFVALRVLARRVPRKIVWGWDDLLIIPSWIVIVIGLSLNIYAIHENLKSTSTTATPLEAEQALSNTLRGIYGVQMVFIPSYLFPKLSILAMYLRIFPQKHMRIMIWSLIIFMILDGIAFLLPAILICNPPDAFWNFTVHGKCIDNDAYNRSVPVPNIVTDIIMLILPIPTIWNLKASLAKRIGLFFTFATGSVGFIVAIVRWAYFLKYSVHSSSVEITSKLDILGVVEPSAYLIAACLPPLRALVGHIWSASSVSSLSEIFHGSRNTSTLKTSETNHLKNGTAEKHTVTETASNNSGSLGDHSDSNEKGLS